MQGKGCWASSVCKTEAHAICTDYPRVVRDYLQTRSDSKGFRKTWIKGSAHKMVDTVHRLWGEVNKHLWVFNYAVILLYKKTLTSIRLLVNTAMLSGNSHRDTVSFCFVFFIRLPWDRSQNKTDQNIDMGKKRRYSNKTFKCCFLRNCFTYWHSYFFSVWQMALLHPI